MSTLLLLGLVSWMAAGVLAMWVYVFMRLRRAIRGTRLPWWFWTTWVAARPLRWGSFTWLLALICGPFGWMFTERARRERAR